MTTILREKTKITEARKALAIDQQFLTKSQTAELLGVTQRTITNWMRRKMLPYFKLGKGMQADVRFRHSDIVDKLTANNRVN